jgi:hypothetical protein
MRFIIVLTTFLIASIFPSAFGAELMKTSAKRHQLANFHQKMLDVMFNEDNSVAETPQIRSEEIATLGVPYLQGYLTNIYSDEKCGRSTEMYHSGYKLNACIPQKPSGAYKLYAQIVDGNVRAYKQNFVDVDCNEPDGARRAWKDTLGMCNQLVVNKITYHFKAEIRNSYWDGVWRNRALSNVQFRGADRCEASQINDVLTFDYTPLNDCVNFDTTAWTDWKWTTCNPADTFFTEVVYSSSDTTCSGTADLTEYDRGCGSMGNELYMKQLCL